MLILRNTDQMLMIRQQSRHTTYYSQYGAAWGNREGTSNEDKQLHTRETCWKESAGERKQPNTTKSVVPILQAEPHKWQNGSLNLTSR